MEVRDAAKQIIELVGGKENINTVENCMTRLRFTLKDESVAKDDEIKSISLVQGIMKAGGQYQIVIGKQVSEVCKEVKKLIGYEENSAKDAQPASNMKWYERILDILSGSMIPLIGVIIGSGMILALTTLLNTFGILSSESGTYQFFNAIGNVGIYFLPMFVGYTSAKKLGTNPFLGMFVGAAMIYPSLTELISAEEGLTLFGLKLQNYSYASTIIPVILAVWFMSYVEKLAKKICPKVIESFGVPTIIILITVPVTYLVIGPIGSIITQAINVSVMFLSEHVGFLAIGLIAAVMPVLVMSGLHMSLIPIMLMIIATTGNDPIVAPSFLVYNIGVAGAALAIALRTKNAEYKQLGFSTSISALLGVSEPGLFGLLVVLKRPLFATMIAGAISGILAGFVGYVGIVPMSQSILSIPAAADGGSNILKAVIVTVISFAVSFVINYIWGMKKEDLEAEQTQSSDNSVVTDGAAEGKEAEIYSPIKGKTIALDTVEDEVFSSKMMGDGIAIEPEEGVVYAPFDGTLETLFPTRHAMGFVSDTGCEVVVHVGFNTVELNGELFETHVEQGERVKKGQKIVTFDIDELKSRGYSVVTPVVVTNTDSYTDIEKKEQIAADNATVIVKCSR